MSFFNVSIVIPSYQNEIKSSNAFEMFSLHCLHKQQHNTLNSAVPPRQIAVSEFMTNSYTIGMKT